MTADQHRLYAAIVSAAAAGLMAVADGWQSGLTLLTGCVLAAMLIWFAEPLSEFVGRVGFRQITRPSPPGLVRFFGWLALVLFLVASAAAALRTVP